MFKQTLLVLTQTISRFNATIHDQEVKIIIDTGATASWADRAACNRLGLTIEVSPNPIVSVGANNAHVRQYGLTTSLMYIDEVAFPLGLNVTDLPSVCDVLLGCNFLRQYNAVVDVSAGRVVLRHPRQPNEQIVWTAASQPVQRRAQHDPGKPSQPRAAALADSGNLHRSSHGPAAKSAAPCSSD